MAEQSDTGTSSVPSGGGRGFVVPVVVVIGAVVVVVAGAAILLMRTDSSRGPDTAIRDYRSALGSWDCERLVDVTTVSYWERDFAWRVEADDLAGAGGTIDRDLAVVGCERLGASYEDMNLSTNYSINDIDVVEERRDEATVATTETVVVGAVDNDGEVHESTEVQSYRFSLIREDDRWKVDDYRWVD